MKVLMIHVGNEIQRNPALGDEFYLQRKSLLDGKLKDFLKHDIINADTQMQSLINESVDIEYGHLSNRKSIASLFKAGRRIQQICREQQIELVHVLWGSTTALMTVLFSPKPVVISFCGSDLLGNKDVEGNLTRGGKINRMLSRLAARFSHHNITKSEQMRRYLPLAVQWRTTAVPNGVDLKGFYPIEQETARQKVEFALDKKYVLFFYTEGQVVKNKKMAMAVMEHVHNAVPNVELFLATKIPHEELLYYYNACDVMILTSFHEGSNNSLKEANACNLPIVSVGVGDAKERLEGIKNSFVVEERDPIAFAEKVIAVLNNGERSDGIKGSEQVSIKAVAKKVIDVYEKVLQK